MIADAAARPGVRPRRRRLRHRATPRWATCATCSEISGLKLDRSFVTHLDDDPRAAAIVESTITLARSLGLSVVAEGVETAPERDRLASLGCELAQGYHFSRPVPAALLPSGVIAAARTDDA